MIEASETYKFDQTQSHEELIGFVDRAGFLGAAVCLHFPKPGSNNAASYELLIDYDPTATPSSVNPVSEEDINYCG